MGAAVGSTSGNMGACDKVRPWSVAGLGAPEQASHVRVFAVDREAVVMLGVCAWGMQRVRYLVSQVAMHVVAQHCPDCS
jgi:hypothetical protein